MRIPFLRQIVIDVTGAEGEMPVAQGERFVCADGYGAADTAFDHARVGDFADVNACHPLPRHILPAQGIAATNGEHLASVQVGLHAVQTEDVDPAGFCFEQCQGCAGSDVGAGTADIDDLIGSRRRGRSGCRRGYNRGRLTANDLGLSKRRQHEGQAENDPEKKPLPHFVPVPFAACSRR